jgi:hypothetical protein
MLLGVALAFIISLGFTCIVFFASAFFSEEIAPFAMLFGLFGFFGVLMGGIFLFIFRANRLITARLDEAFAPFGLTSQRYLFAGRQYRGTYRGRQINAYYYVSGGRYLRVPNLQIYVSGKIPTRISIGPRSAISNFVGNLANRTELTLTDPEFAELVLYPDDPHWARTYLADPQVREDVIHFMGDATPGNLRLLMVGPGSTSLTLRHFATGQITPSVASAVIRGLNHLAEIAEQQPAPARLLEETELVRRGRENRMNPSSAVLIIFIAVVLCPALLISAFVALLALTGAFP